MKESKIIELFQTKETDFSDDCALIGIKELLSPKEKLLITTDSIVENTHFSLKWSKAEDLAVKLFQSNLSDIVVSGGEPLFALLNLGFTEYISTGFLRKFSRTLLSELKKERVSLIGGDTFRSDILSLSLTLVGKTKRPLLRSGGGIGHTLFVSGSLGLSLSGYRHLKNEIRLPPPLAKVATKKHLRPVARRDWAYELAKNPKTKAVMDISDGLLQDAKKLAEASKVSLEMETDKIPVFPGLEGLMSPMEAAISGEEYELLFLAERDIKLSFPFTAIGRAVKKRKEKIIVKEKGKILRRYPVGFEH